MLQSLERMMMETREPLEWHFKQLDHSMGLSFKTNFNFAIVGHLLKGACCLPVFVLTRRDNGASCIYAWRNSNVLLYPQSGRCRFRVTVLVKTVG